MKHQVFIWSAVIWINQMRKLSLIDCKYCRTDLAENVQEKRECQMGEASVITCGKGRVGKTTTAAAGGTAFALMSQKVCLIDADIGLRNLDVGMGFENRIIYDVVV